MTTAGQPLHRRPVARWLPEGRAGNDSGPRQGRGRCPDWRRHPGRTALCPPSPRIVLALGGTHWRPFLVLQAGGAVPIGRRARWAGRLATAVAGQLDRWLRVEQRVPADEPVDMVWVAFGPTATHAAGPDRDGYQPLEGARSCLHGRKT